MDDDTRRHIRQCWGCDCDGESHKIKLRPKGSARKAVDIVADGIEKLTGYRPPTCPWRAMYDPLVGPVIDLCRLGEANLGGNALTEEDPEILWEAVNIYLRSRNGVRAHDEAEEHKAHLAKLKAQRK